MGPGHLGVAFAAKPLTPKAPLWTLLVASEALDLLSFIFISLGVEEMALSQMDFQGGLQTLAPGSIPWSHGFTMSVAWSLLFAGISHLFTKDWKASGVIGLVTFSHWVLDFIVHPPDLPLLFQGSPELGLGLWTSGAGFIFSLVLELVLIGGGLVIYLLWRKRQVS